MVENLQRKVRETSEVEPNEVVLYHGSLDELNKLGEHRYDVATESVEYVSSERISFPETLKTTFPIREELLRMGFHGLVNRRTFYSGKDGEDDLEKETLEMDVYRIEGTPVVILDD